MGVILGTAAYMAPEQARGSAVDRRVDVWAFGVVLWEMLTGRRLFEGATVSDTLAAVLKNDPDWSALPAALPSSIRRLLRRSLDKDRKLRLQHIGDARLEIAEAGMEDGDRTSLSQPPGAEPPGVWRRLRPWLAGAVAGAIIAVAALAGWRAGAPSSTPLTRLTIGLGGSLLNGLAIDPEGRQIVYAAGDGGLYLRFVSAFDATPIVGTESIAATYPSFSPDGLSIAFAVGSTVMSVPTRGGVVGRVGDVGADVTGLSWSDEHLLVAVGNQGILRLPAGGGPSEQLVTLQADEHAAAPQLMPDGHTVLFTLATGSPEPNWNTARLVLQSEGSEQRDEIRPGIDGRYLNTGHLVYADGGVWFAVAFDAERRQEIGAPLSMVEGVTRQTWRGIVRPGANVDVSETGVLVFQPGPASLLTNERVLVSTDRRGEDTPLGIAAGPYESPRVSPDGRQLAVSTNVDQQAAVWVYDMSGESARRQLTFAGRNRLPVWSPDSQRLAFQSDREGDLGIFVQRADGTEAAERLTLAESGEEHVPESWSSDDRYLSFSVLSDSGAELWLLSLADGKPAAFGDLHASRLPFNSAFSPDGRWIAYTLRNEDTAVYVQPVPSTGALHQVSPTPEIGHHPFWGPDGSNELFYFGNGGGDLVSVQITLSPTVRWENAERVPGDHTANTTGETPLNYDITPDGLRFVRTVPPEDSSVTRRGADLRVILNWFEELKRRVPVR
jgi:serine/threonine-protein kinase